MAFLLASERPAALSLNPVRFLPAWFAKARAERARSVALNSLLQLDDFRLDDLGLCRQDILEAIESARPAKSLAAARARRARAWYRP